MNEVKHELPTSQWSCRPDPSEQMAGMDMWEINHGTDTEVVAERVYGQEAANLIAAAPELLKALVEVMSALDAATQDFEYPDAKKTGTAAIAKALHK